MWWIVLLAALVVALGVTRVMWTGARTTSRADVKALLAVSVDLEPSPAKT